MKLTKFAGPELLRFIHNLRSKSKPSEEVCYKCRRPLEKGEGTRCDNPGCPAVMCEDCVNKYGRWNFCSDCFC